MTRRLVAVAGSCLLALAACATESPAGAPGPGGTGEASGTPTWSEQSRAAPSGDAAEPVPHATSRPTVVVGDAEPVVAEVADDDDERGRGLMGREDVPPGTGMLFVYDAPVRTGTWMGNVPAPLSVVWIDGAQVVGVAEMQPCPAADATCPIYYPDDPDARYDLKLEAAGGTFTEAGVVPGDPVQVTGLDPG